MKEVLTDTYSFETTKDQESYEALLRNLRRREGFGILLVCCSSPPQTQKIISQIQEDLSDKKIDVLNLDCQIDNLYQLIQNKLQTQRIDILMIGGIEKSFVNYIKPGIGGQGDYYKLENIPPLLGHLNLQRERFRDDFNIALVFFLPLFALKYLVRRAPDFFDWRSGIFNFSMAKDVLTQESLRVMDGDYEQYLQLTSQERYHKIIEIKDLIDETQQTDNIKAELWRKIGLLYYANTEYDQALSSFDKALEFKPDDYLAWNNRGNALGNLGRNEEAIASYDQALAIKLDYHLAWNNRGNALDELGRLEEAITSYNKALEFKPDDHEAWFNRGNTLINLGRNEEAIASYDQALAIKPDFHLAWNNRGYALDNLGRNEEAIASYDQALAIKPDFHLAWFNRGIALDNLGRNEEAITSYDQALDIKPDDHQAWYNRGYALGQLGRLEEAITSYDKVLEIKPDDHQAWNNRGYALRQLGRSQEAITSYDKALEFKPDEELYINNHKEAIEKLHNIK